MSGEENRRPRSALLKRLPFLALVAVGLLLWRAPWLPQERELVWALPADRDLREVDIQLWQGQTLLKREQRFFPARPQGEWVWRVQLRRGDYRAEVFARAADGATLHAEHPFHVEADEAVRLPLLAR